MKLFKSLLGKKTDNNEKPSQKVKVQDSVSFTVVNWDKHKNDINALLTEMEKNDAFSKEYDTTRLPCVIKPEKDNPVDKNAMLVIVKCPKDGKKWYTVGYVPADLCQDVKNANKLVNDKTHYWCCNMSYSKVSGTKFYIELKPSNYAK